VPGADCNWVESGILVRKGLARSLGAVPPISRR